MDFFLLRILNVFGQSNRDNYFCSSIISAAAFALAQVYDKEGLSNYIVMLGGLFTLIGKPTRRPNHKSISSFCSVCQGLSA